MVRNRGQVMQRMNAQVSAIGGSSSESSVALPTLVLDEGGAITRLEEMQLLLCCIGGTNGLDDRGRALADRLFGMEKARASFEAAAGELVGLLAPAASGNAYAKEMLAKTRAHLEQTRLNRSAYTTDDKLNEAAVFWPNPTREGGHSIEGLDPYAKQYGLIDRGTAIGSAGSCFAVEIADRLQRGGFNYVVTEEAPLPPFEHAYASAHWGAMYNTPSFRQLIETAYGLRELPPLLSTKTVDDRQVYREPFRDSVAFETVEEYEADRANHLAAAREALSKVEVFVMTLGLNEVWYLKSDGSAFARSPWRFCSSLVEHRELSVEENVAELQGMLDVWRSQNSGLKLVVSVSPVPLGATFMGAERHVVEATCLSKSVLRVAAQQFVNANSDVFYFPSFEKVMYCTKEPWAADERHVRREAVDGVMGLFEKMFVREGCRI